MQGMRPLGTPEQLEARRRRAIELLEAGASLSEVARALKSSVSSVHRWYQAYQKKGSDGLAPLPTPGRPPKLSAAQQERLRELLQRGPPAAGYDTTLWTLRRVADLIETEFEVTYHPCHVWRILQSMGWSCQKPECRARERNDADIERWRQRHWSHIKKRPAARP